MKKYLIFSLFLIILVSTSSVQAVSVVLPNNLNFPTYDQSFINFNSVNTGYTVLTFIKPESNICRELQLWLNDSKNNYDNINFFMVTPEESPSLAKYYNKTDPKIPIIIDENNTLKTILEADRVPSIYIFKDGKLITSIKWPMEENEKKLSKLFDDISKDNLLPHIKKEYIYSGKFFPNIEGKTINNSKIKTSEMKWPALVFIIDLQNQSYQEMLEKTNKIYKNVDISAMYFIINNKETRIKQNSTIKKLSNKDNMYIIVDENKEINKIIRNNCVETDSEIPFLMYVNNQTIKWAKFAYNSNNFEEVINTVINSWKK